MAARRRESKRKNWPANLYQKADGYFWYRNPETGKTKGLGHDRVAAFDEARTANLVLASQKATSLAAWLTGGGVTLEEYAKEFEKSYLATHTKPNTVKQIKSTIRFICDAPFAGKAINTVATKEIFDFLNATELARGPIAARQRRQMLVDLFTKAEREGKIESGKNPVTITQKPSKKVQRGRLSIEQFIKIRESAEGWLVNAMNLALVSGQSRAEISLAMFGDYKDGFWYCDRGKTEAKIRIPLYLRMPALNLTLEDVVRQCRDDVVSKYLIHHRTSTPRAKAGAKVGIDTISKEFAEARDRSGIVPEKDKTLPTFHEIRSLAGRIYKELYGEEFVKALLGHRSLKTTETYLNPRSTEQKWIDAIPVQN